MTLKIVITTYLGIAVVDIETGEVYESGYDNMTQARKALRNFKEWWG